ncbi:unnamed protein product [Closterium sp. Naga37s-1]|nr:unnamed protein product [Closterium sp. Naga37s-1]
MCVGDQVKLSDDLLIGLHFHKAHQLDLPNPNAPMPPVSSSPPGPSLQLQDDCKVAFVEGRLHPSSCAPPAASLSLLPHNTGPPLLSAPSGSGQEAKGQRRRRRGRGEGGEGRVGAEEGGASGGERGH